MHRFATLLSMMMVASLLLGLLPINTFSGNDQTRTPIKHIVILMMENHSFDNIFGVYGRAANGSMAVGITLPRGMLGKTMLANLSPVPPGNFTASNPVEGLYNYLTDWNNGSMNGFVNGSGPNSMLYYGASQMALEWDLAENYALADMYFSSVLSETLPNRLFSLAGFSPVGWDVRSPPPFVLYDQTIFHEMDTHGVTWAYYLENPAPSSEPLNFIYGITGHSSNIRSWSDFVSGLHQNTLPSVSWISSIAGGASGYSQHPPDNVLAGEIWMFYIVSQIMQSPCWNSTAIFITYDEGGGYYDSVPPPSLHGDQLGFRVPMIVISPYAKETYISNTVMSHTSLLAFIDYNWNMPPLNILVSMSNLPLDMFDFSIPYGNQTLARPPIQLGPSLGTMIPATLADSVQYANQFSNTSYLFPAKLQYSAASLPYNTSGQSDFNLSQVAGRVFVKNDIDYFPPGLLSTPYLAIMIGGAASFAAVSVVIYAIRKRR